MADARQGGAGALGPRLLGRLTAELIHRSPQYMSCINYYEIDLRGERSRPKLRGPLLRRPRSLDRCGARARPAHATPRCGRAHGSSGNKIGAIENLGATEVSAEHARAMLESGLPRRPPHAPQQHRTHLTCPRAARPDARAHRTSLTPLTCRITLSFGLRGSRGCRASRCYT